MDSRARSNISESAAYEAALFHLRHGRVPRRPGGGAQAPLVLSARPSGGVSKDECAIDPPPERLRVSVAGNTRSAQSHAEELGLQLSVMRCELQRGLLGLFARR